MTMSKRGKKYIEATKLIDENKAYSMEEAADLLTQTSVTKFDASCEIHINTGIDPKQADQIVRSTVVLPNGTGKDLKIVAIVPAGSEDAAKKAGAIEAGEKDLIDKIAKGWLDFDIVVATPDMMKDLAKIAKVLGPKGLMPSPKAGTVAPDFENVINELKKGKVEFKNDKNGILHNTFGKVSFGKDKLLENLKTFVKAVADAKPSGIKGAYVKSISVATSMGPSIRLDHSLAISASQE